jgi:transcription antitermination factor NusG
MNEGKWFAVYTSPGWEKKVTDLLTKKKIKAYCPTNKISSEWSNRRQGISEPLFASYVFVQIREGDEFSVLKTNGVISFVYWLGKPAQIHNEEIEAMKNFLIDYSNVKLEKTRVEVGGTMQIVRDPLMLRKGNVLEVRNSAIKIFLPSLGHAIIAEVRKENAEIGSYTQELNLSI